MAGRDEEDYRAEDIHPVAIPQWERLNDEWVRNWEIGLVAPAPPSSQAVLDHLSESNIDVTVALSTDRRTLRIRTVATEKPYSDEIFIWAAYRMLRRIDEGVQRIDTIQGQPRAWWQPFR